MVERAPEKREVTGSTPVPTTTKALVTGGAGDAEPLPWQGPCPNRAPRAGLPAITEAVRRRPEPGAAAQGPRSRGARLRRRCRRFDRRRSSRQSSPRTPSIVPISVVADPDATTTAVGGPPPCRSTVGPPPCGPGVQPGQRVAYSIDSGCGPAVVAFDGMWWTSNVAPGPAPYGWGAPSETGTMT